jgi:hypothetical protein
MPYLTINEVGLGTLKPDGTRSISGHMWYQLTDLSFGGKSVVIS